MNEESEVAILFGPEDQALFEISDNRERADRLQEVILPKLEDFLDETCEFITEIYGEGALQDTRRITSPAHRKNAKRTMRMPHARAGLGVIGKPHYFNLSFELDDDGFRAIIDTSRPREASTLMNVLRRDLTDSIELLEFIDGTVSYPTDAKGDFSELADVVKFLEVDHTEQWFHVAFCGTNHPWPIVSTDAVGSVIFDFVALFPIFQSVADSFLGKQNRFSESLAKYWENITDETQNGTDEPLLYEETKDETADVNAEASSDDGLLEGEFRLLLKGHRARERGLRKRKIREALKRGDGRLICEVPGCGFDFVAVYGELGRGFAHVHHLRPLSQREQPELTKLIDLAIVCPNCHAMIHRGGTSRPLEGLIPGKSANVPSFRIRS